METNLDLSQFRQRLAETIAWCAPRASVDDPEHCLRTPALQPAPFDPKYSRWSWFSFVKIWEQYQHLAPFYAQITEILKQQGVPVQTVTELDSECETERQDAVNVLATKRAELLRQDSIFPASSTINWAGGMLLLHDIDSTLSDGAAEGESKYFFDPDNVPPWDTWVAYIRDDSKNKMIKYNDGDVPTGAYSSYLVCWIPPQMFDLACAGIAANPEGCIMWAAHLDCAFTRELRSAGLL